MLKKIAESLDSNPELKKRLKYIYQFVLFYLFRTPGKYYIAPNVHVRRVTPPDKDGFFGYYSLRSQSEGRIVHHVVERCDAEETRSKKKISIFLDENVIGQTSAWNWQQGAMLHWSGPERIVWNSYDKIGDRYISNIYSLSNCTLKKLSYPAAASSATKNVIGSLSFERLAKLRPDYGYFSKKTDGVNAFDFEDEIKIISIEDDAVLARLTARRLIESLRLNLEGFSDHKFNHLDFSPSGEYLMFLFRWRDSSGHRRHRLIVWNWFENKILSVLESRMISHCCWKSDSVILGWLRYDEVDAYYSYDLSSRIWKKIESPLFLGDGHPSCSPDGKWMVTDGYPARDRKSPLFLYNFKTEKSYLIGRFLSPLKFRDELRCDLHPRWSDDGQSVTIDSVHEGSRAMYQVTFSKFFENLP